MVRGIKRQRSTAILWYSLKTNRYSVPTIYVGEKVTVKATADEVKILNKGTMIASHPRYTDATRSR